jgi:hypothetical protein
MKAHRHGLISRLLGLLILVFGLALCCAPVQSRADMGHVKSHSGSITPAGDPQPAVYLYGPSGPVLVPNASIQQGGVFDAEDHYIGAYNPSNNGVYNSSGVQIGYVVW